MRRHPNATVGLLPANTKRSTQLEPQNNNNNNPLDSYRMNCKLLRHVRISLPDSSHSITSASAVTCMLSAAQISFKRVNNFCTEGFGKTITCACSLKARTLGAYCTVPHSHPEDTHHWG